MKKIGILAVVGLMMIAVFSAFEKKEEMLNIGDKMPVTDVKMKNVDTQVYTLGDLAGEKGTLVIFSCNTCPFVIGNGSKSEGWQNRYPEVASLSEEMGVSFVLINSNEAKRTAGDSFDDMQKQYKEQNYSGYYLLDPKSEVADAFGALTTPHVYLFNAKNELVYRGAIDDNVNRASEVKETYLKDALENMIEGKKIEPELTRQIGCSIKRV